MTHGLLPPLFRVIAQTFGFVLFEEFDCPQFRLCIHNRCTYIYIYIYIYASARDGWRWMPLHVYIYTKIQKLQTMPLSPFLASSRQPPVAASCSCCQPCSHGRHAGNIDCKTSRCSSTVRRGHSCERGSNEIPLQLLSIQLCQIYESIFLMLFSCHCLLYTSDAADE